MFQVMHDHSCTTADDHGVINMLRNIIIFAVFSISVVSAMPAKRFDAPRSFNLTGFYASGLAGQYEAQ